MLREPRAMWVEFLSGRSIKEIAKIAEVKPVEIEQAIREQIFERLVPPGDDRDWTGHDSWGPQDACRMPGPKCSGKVRAVDYDGINDCPFLLCEFHREEYRKL